MTYNFTTLNEKISSIDEWLKNEFSSIRTGRATPQVIDNIRVDAYGSKVPINQIATISTEDAKTLRIIPFDGSQSKEIEKAIVSSGIGFSVSVDDRGLRIIFPQLTAENRSALARVVKEKLEQARVSIRNERDEVWNDIQKKEKDGEISEDERFRYKEDMQKIIDEGNALLDTRASKKEQEIIG